MESKEIPLNTIEAIRSRRSIRRYTGEPIAEEALMDMLRDAMQAPSANNQQPWRFILVRGQEHKDALASIHSWYSAIHTSAAVFIVCADLNESPHPFYLHQDCAAATENLLLSATARGYGSLWMGIKNDDTTASKVFSEQFHIPSHIQPFALVAVGHELEKVNPVNRFDSAKLHIETW